MTLALEDSHLMWDPGILRLPSLPLSGPDLIPRHILTVDFLTQEGKNLFCSFSLNISLDGRKQASEF